MIKCEINQALDTINLYVKFNMHSSYANKLYSAKSGGEADGQVDGRTEEHAW